NLHEELALAGELEDLVVLFRTAAQPHVVVAFNEDSMWGVDPLIAGAWPAPGLKEFSTRRELEHGRRWNAALCLGRRQRGGLLALGNTGLPVKNPQVVVRID